jgi:hypothetical protein
VDVLFFYKRTIAMNLVSSGFQKADATSTIEYDLVGETSARLSSALYRMTRLPNPVPAPVSTMLLKTRNTSLTLVEYPERPDTLPPTWIEPSENLFLPITRLNNPCPKALALRTQAE